MERRIQRGDLYYADLNPVVGSEQGGIRPVLIIQNDKGNLYSPTVIVVMISSKVSSKSFLPTHYQLKAGMGLLTDSILLLEQIRTIDKIRLKEFLGTIEPCFMDKIDQYLAISIGLENLLFPVSCAFCSNKG